MSNENGNKHKVYAPDTRFVFDGFEIDPSNRICVRDDVELPISGKVFDVLLAFIESPGRLLTKDELIERVWFDNYLGIGICRSELWLSLLRDLLIARRKFLGVGA